MFRTTEEKQEILSRLEPTRVYENVISDDLLNKLISFYESSDKTYKSTGPVTVEYMPYSGIYEHKHDPWWLELDSIITDKIGDHGLFATNFFEVTQPHIIHNDDSINKKPRLHKTVVVPIKISKPTKFAVFDQCYLEGPIKGRHGSTLKADKPKYYNDNLLDNSVLEYYTGRDFDKQVWADNFTHQPYIRYHGLSIESIVTWNPGDIIIFDTARLHCAVDFKSQGIEKKLGYSVFTQLEK